MSFKVDHSIVKFPLKITQNFEAALGNCSNNHLKQPEANVLGVFSMLLCDFLILKFYESGP